MTSQNASSTLLSEPVEQRRTRYRSHASRDRKEQKRRRFHLDRIAAAKTEKARRRAVTYWLASAVKHAEVGAVVTVTVPTSLDADPTLTVSVPQGRPRR